MALLTRQDTICVHCMIRELKYPPAGGKVREKFRHNLSQNLVISRLADKSQHFDDQDEDGADGDDADADEDDADARFSGCPAQRHFRTTTIPVYKLRPCRLVVNITRRSLKFNLIFDPQAHF